MKKILLILSLLLTGKNFGQDTIIQKNNPIIFGELLLGYGGNFSEYTGIIYGGNINYQIKKHFFTARYIFHPELNLDTGFVGTTFPIVHSKYKNTEIGLLYGLRFIKDEHSFSFSVGVSRNDFKTREESLYGEIRSFSNHNFGMAYELNMKWFNSRKYKYEIYGLFPVGKPTAFGRSIGFKIIGNISEYSYIGAGITYGLGLHKVY